jgi:methyl-accepting chemotaxis protein
LNDSLIIRLCLFTLSKNIKQEAGINNEQIKDKITSAISALADGDIALAKKISKELDNQFSQPILKTVTSMEALYTDINMISSRVLEGQIDSHTNVNIHSGIYKNLALSVNSMLETIKDPFEKISQLAEKIANGSDLKKIDNTYQGSFAAIIDNLNLAVESLTEMLQGATLVTKAVQNGELETRADISNLKGEYAYIISDFNSILDSINMPFNAANEFITNLAEGVRQEEIDNNFNGCFATLIDNLNKVRYSLAIMIAESKKLEDAGLRGELTVRGDESKLKGFYLKTIHGINSTLDSVTAPLSEAEIVLGNMAANDYTQKMVGNYKGMMSKFSDSINDVNDHLLSIQSSFESVSKGDTSMLEHYKDVGKRSENDRQVPAIIAMMESVRNLIDESNMLATATSEGNLGVRGDSSKFQGDYKKIIEGMNKMMEAVAAPLTECSSTFLKLAQGDLTVRMSGKYKGAYSELKSRVCFVNKKCTKAPEMC